MTRHQYANLAATLALCLVLAGCNAGPVVSPGRVENSPANVAEWNEDPVTNGRQHRTVVQGGLPAIVGTDANGSRWQGSAQPRTVTFASRTSDGVERVATIIDPSDTELTGFRMLPDGTVELDTFGAVASVPLAVQNEAIIQSLLTTEKITAEQAAVIRQAIQSGATLAEAIARVAAGAIVPGP